MYSEDDYANLTVSTRLSHLNQSDSKQPINRNLDARINNKAHDMFNCEKEKSSTRTVLRDLSSLRDQEVGPNAVYCSFIADLETVTNVRDIAW